jgi:3-phosphoshikimate 1-carboxyvinyltransferase
MQKTLKLARKFAADVTPPTSKSISNRALMLQALCRERRYTIEQLAVCDDTEHMLEGIETKKAGAALIDIGATGTAMRFLTAYLAITPGETTITGSERMQQRPIGTLVEALRMLGADITYMNREGFPPLRIQGKPLQGGTLEIEAGISSQYISALLMIGPCMKEGLTLKLKGNIASRTYIELTLDLMRHYGATAEWADERTLRIEPGRYEDKPLSVEGDWSGASYWYELAAVAAHYGYEVDIRLHGMREDSRQGDRVVAQLFEELGVKTEYAEKGVELLIDKAPCGIDNSQFSILNFQFEKDFTHCPDIAQTMAVTYCLLGTPFTFTGIQSLRIKETDRVAALIHELRKLGFVLRAEGDERLIWDGTRCTPDEHPVIATYDDHRMAMAFAPAALCHEELTIKHPEVVTKSYPNFWEDLKQIKN